MSCRATPAHAREPLEWRIRQRSRKRLAVQRGGAAENCFICHAELVSASVQRRELPVTLDRFRIEFVMTTS